MEAFRTYSHAMSTSPPVPGSVGRGLGRRALPVLLAVIFVNIMGFGIVVPLLPFYASAFEAPPWQIALIFGAYSAGAFFGEPLWGRLSDRIGRKPLLVSTVVGNCLCYGALAFAPDVASALIIRFLGGLASGNGSVIQGYIADVTPVERRSGRMALLGAAFNLGLIIGPALGFLVHEDAGPAGFRIPLLLASGLSAASALGVLLFVQESRPGGGRVEAQESRWRMLGFVWRSPVVSRLVLLNLLVGIAFTGVESIFGLWGRDRFDWGPQEVGIVFACAGVASAIGQLALTDPLSRRFGEAPVLAAGTLLMSVCVAIQPLSTGLAFTTVLVCLSSLGASVAFPNVSALISRVTDEDNQGQVLGINNAGGALSRVVGPLIAGTLFAGVTIDAPFLWAAVVTLPGVWLALAAGRKAQTAKDAGAGSV